MKSIDDMCRVCLARVGTKDVFSAASKIVVCAGVSVRPGDGLPRKMCARCDSALDAAYRFRMICVSTDRLLREGLPCPAANRTDAESPRNANFNIQTKNAPSNNNIEILLNNGDNDKIQFISQDITEAMEELGRCGLASLGNVTISRTRRPFQTYPESENLGDYSPKTPAPELITGLELRDPFDDMFPGSESVDPLSESGFDDGGKTESAEETDLPVEETADTKSQANKWKSISRKRTIRQPEKRKAEPSFELRELVRAGLTLAQIQDLVSSGPGDVTSSKEPASQLTCAMCGERCEDEAARLTHSLRAHGRPAPGRRAPPARAFRCGECGLACASRASLRQHVTCVHEARATYMCEVCGRAFTRLAYLRAHLVAHGGERRHACPFCPWRTTQKQNLNLHIRRHTGERPFACEVCGLRCVSSSNLRVHRRRHDGSAARHSCHLCGASFGYASSLREHVAATHAGRLYTCARCGATYSRRRGLRTHLQQKHSMSREQISAELQSNPGALACDNSGREQISAELRGMPGVLACDTSGGE